MGGSVLSTPCTFVIDHAVISVAKEYATQLDAALPSRFKRVSNASPSATITDVVLRSLEEPVGTHSGLHKPFYENSGTQALVLRVLHPLQDQAKEDGKTATADDDDVGEATRLLAELQPTIEALLRLLVADSVRHMKLAWEYEKKMLIAERQTSNPVGRNDRKSHPGSYECVAFLDDIIQGISLGFVSAAEQQAIFTASIGYQRLIFTHLSNCVRVEGSDAIQVQTCLPTAESNSFGCAGVTALVCAQSFEQRLAVMELLLTCDPVSCIRAAPRFSITNSTALAINGFFDFYTELLAMSHAQILARFPVRSCADTTALAASERRLSKLASHDPSDIPTELLEANGPILLATDDVHHAFSVQDLFWALALTSADLFSGWMSRSENIMNPGYPYNYVPEFPPPMMKLLAKLLPLVPVHDWDSLPPLAHHRYTLANDAGYKSLRKHKHAKSGYFPERINDLLAFLTREVIPKNGCKPLSRISGSNLHLIQRAGRHQRSLDFWLVRWRLQCIRGVCNDVVAVMLEFLVGPLTFPAQFIRDLKLS